MKGNNNEKTIFYDSVSYKNKSDVRKYIGSGLLTSILCLSCLYVYNTKKTEPIEVVEKKIAAYYVSSNFSELDEYMNRVNVIANKRIHYLLGKIAIERSRNYEKALEHFESASKEGHLRSKYELGKLHMIQGEGRYNIKLAEWYFNTASDQGESDAMNMLAIMHLNNILKNSSCTNALRWLDRAVKAGNERSQQVMNDVKRYTQKGDTNEHNKILFILGSMYRYGAGVDKDIEQSVEYYRSASRYGDSKTMLVLGNLYYEGNETKQHYQLARMWFEKAAELDESLAMYHLGVMYEKGEGVIKNREKAYWWYERGATLGNSESMMKVKDWYKETMK